MTEKERHPSLARLFEAVEKLGVNTPTQLATELEESEQTVTNWATRGVSKVGALKAEERLGVSSVWILRGKESAAIPAVANRNWDGSYLLKLLAAVPQDRQQQAYLAATQLLIGYLDPHGQ